jgi:diaminohydroxyphosphoribosylaminopyrimidine deaminase/5-amino-6-(5-phosphoribosylamino)uracil reductase
MVGQACPADRIHALTGAGATVIACQTGESGRLDLGDILSRLAARGLTRVLVEGGGRLAASFLNADLADRIACFRAPVILGGDAQGMAAEMGLNSLAQARRFRRTQALSCGPDLLEMYEKDA